MLRALLLSLPALAETFDVYSYEAPQGYKFTQHQHVAEFTKINQQRRYYCQFALHRAQRASASAADDAQKEWREVVLDTKKARGQLVTKPLPLPGAAASLVLASETIDPNGSNSITTLFVLRQPERYVGILYGVSNAEGFESCQADADRLISSIRFNAPTQAAPAAPPAKAGIVGGWERVTASPPAGQYNYATKQWQYDPVIAMNQFRHNRRYRFESNGTYTFELNGEDFNRKERTYTWEGGAYSLNNGTLTLTPRECRVGKGPAGQNPKLSPCAVPATSSIRVRFEGVALMFNERDGSWSSYQPLK